MTKGSSDDRSKPGSESSDPRHRSAQRSDELGAAETKKREPASGGEEETLDLARLAPVGLHIRCPHCRNHVEYLDEQEPSDITCGTCGSVFSLVNSAKTTRHSTALSTVGNFELIDRLGMGGFGTVWKAYDPDLDRSVAVKIPRREQLDPVDETQFFREARVAAQLRHPNIVSVHEIGREGDTLFIVSDLIRGVTLSEFIAARRLATPEIIELCVKVAKALHHAHEQGVVHRDLKPSNIMIDQENEPHLTDFGLAKRDIGELTMTADGQILGTPAYMSPEQAGGDAHHVDRRSDIYSLGVVLFELLTSELPFRGSAQMQIHQRMTDDPPRPRSMNRNIPIDLETICVKCIQRDPNQRYRSSDQLAEDLERFRNGEAILARPISRVEQTIRWMKRHPWPATAAALVTVLAVAGPLAAVTINSLRRQSDELVRQKETLIEDRDENIEAAEKDILQLQETNSDLRIKLGTWEQGVDPSLFWPAYQMSPPHVQVLETIADDQRYVEQLLAQAPRGEPQAYSQLALAIICESLNRVAEAIGHYEAARDALTELTRKHPHETRFARALAESAKRLAGLVANPDLVAEPDLERAVQLYQESEVTLRHLEDSVDLPELQVQLFDVEIQLTIAKGYQRGRQLLLTAAGRLSQIAKNKPRDPQQLYELACFLSGRPPLLTPRSAARE